MRHKVLFGAVLAAILAIAVPSFAQLPEPIEGFGNPAIVAGGSYLSEDPGPGVKRAGFFITANIPGIKIANLPVYVGGIGVTGGGLDPTLSEIQFGTSVPLLTWAVASKQFIVQVGYTKVLTGDVKPSGWYGGVGFSLTSPQRMSYKRAVKKAKKLGGPLPACPY